MAPEPDGTGSGALFDPAQMDRAAGARKAATRFSPNGIAPERLSGAIPNAYAASGLNRPTRMSLTV